MKHLLAGGSGFTHIDRATQQGSSLQGPFDDGKQVGRRLTEVVVLGDASGEILKALSGGAARQGLVAAVDSARQAGRLPTILELHS